MIFKKDKRKITWAEIELDIQKRGNRKDKKFILSGKWKKFVKMQNGFKLFSVDGKWIRNNLSISFNHGGHGLVHEFIPLDEIWVDEYHHNCDCKNVMNGQKVSGAFFESTTIHEITEFKLMRKGMIYWKAHQLALEKEREIGLLIDPYEDTIEVKD
ncbi:MAG: hypothetical protein US61_C0037G0003 [Parcubacteria group bacterium GW2011_GWE2_37_8]|nr:MAG: hypothetical protein US61_C0037G0003 [Parcubacteria group bacterium GW2011_GWE2_37_8]